MKKKNHLSENDEIESDKNLTVTKHRRSNSESPPTPQGDRSMIRTNIGRGSRRTKTSDRTSSNDSIRVSIGEEGNTHSPKHRRRSSRDYVLSKSKHKRSLSDQVDEMPSHTMTKNAKGNPAKQISFNKKYWMGFLVLVSFLFLSAYAYQSIFLQKKYM